MGGFITVHGELSCARSNWSCFFAELIPARSEVELSNSKVISEYSLISVNRLSNLLFNSDKVDFLSLILSSADLMAMSTPINCFSLTLGFNSSNLDLILLTTYEFGV